MNIGIAKAVQSLRPNAEFTLEGNSFQGLTWVDKIQSAPTEAEIDAEVQRLQEEYDSQEYARNRKAEYDDLNQFELMTDDAINGTTTHIDAIKAIKKKYPK
jgi:predicted phosphoribosyltransferase